MDILLDDNLLKNYLLNSIGIPSHANTPIVDGVTCSDSFKIENVNSFININKAFGLKVEDVILSNVIKYMKSYISEKIYDLYVKEKPVNINDNSDRIKTYLQYENVTDLFEYFNHIKDTTFVIMGSGAYHECFQNIQHQQDSIQVKNRYTLEHCLKLKNVVNNCEFYISPHFGYNLSDILLLTGYNINFDIKLDDNLISNLNKLKHTIALDSNNLNVCDIHITYKKINKNNAKLITLQQCEQINYDTI